MELFSFSFFFVFLLQYMSINGDPKGTLLKFTIEIKGKNERHSK